MNMCPPPPSRAIHLPTGGWALIGQDVTIPWDLNGEAFLTEKMYGSPAFFTLLVDLDEMKPSQFIIHVGS